MTRWLIDKAGVQLTVQCKGKAVEQLVSPMLADLQARPVVNPKGIKLTVKGEAGNWQLRDHDADLKRKLIQAGDLIYHLSDRIVFHVADKATSAHCVHAAAVAINGRAMVIPGNSGAGKSSFTAWLVAHGFDYLTDELILLNGANLQGISRPIQIKPGGIEAVSALLANQDSMIKGKLANAVFAESLGGKIADLAEHKVAAIVYTKYKKNAEFSFEPISSAEGGMSWMQNHVNARNLEGHGFRETMELIRNTPCYRLQYSGFDQLPADFSQQLKDILARSE